ncbi:MAG: hypothetical protein EHM55_01165 [Acidobacteria bacterium]|nr:MAG: hypothetical protein EHM55_01165 [Acidobacteriota bacterium]
MHPQPPQHAATVPARVFVPFFVASLALTLTWGATLGMINLARLTTGWGLGTLPRTSVWAHAYVQVFGFMALFIMGVAYHVLPRFVGGTLQHPRLVRWSFWLQLSGVVAIACGFFHGAPFTRPLWIAGGVSLFAAALSFAAVMLGTMASGVPTREPFRRWIAAGACWMVATAAIVLVAAIADDVLWHRVLWTAALSGFITSWIFGVGRRILPIFLGCRPRWAHLERAVFIMYQAGAVAWVIGAWPDTGSTALIVARGAGAALLIVSAIAYTACLGLFAEIGPVLGCGIRNPQSGWERYVFAAWCWLFASLALGPGWTAARLFIGGTEPLLVMDFARHAMAFGFAAQMVLGVASRVVPNFTGKPLWSPSARDAAFYLLNASMMVRALELPVAFGVWVDAWSSIAWAGPLAVLAMTLFALNIIMTVRQQPSAVLQPGIPAHALQPLTTRKEARA